ncbi:hypothetical protein BVRB_9g209450 [Beta vulgaris subsp. vulgaris]|nr:hypothetical protein BVRB_9g209450 [Beta vulgaris subsp. vulgaris]
MTGHRNEKNDIHTLAKLSTKPINKLNTCFSGFYLKATQ